MAYWIIVSNTSEARIYSAKYIHGENFLTLVDSLSHPESRQKRHDQTSDRPGHYQADPSARGAYSAHTDPREVELDKFAKEISERLEQGRTQNSYKHLILVVPSHFYGVLEKYLSSHVSQLIQQTVQKDYTAVTESELEEKLRSHCSPGLE